MSTASQPQRDAPSQRRPDLPGAPSIRARLRRSGALRAGDLVEVLSAAEILRTLDDQGALDAMPFMPEMVPYCGRRFTVDRRTEKLCDTVSSGVQSRRLADTVMLDDLRCTGDAHGGCQAECRLYWKEAWLRRVDPADQPETAAADPDATAALLRRVEPHTRRADCSGVRYRCQATEMVAASERLSTYDPRPYFRELSSGNVTVGTFVRVMSRAAVMQPLQHLGKLQNPPLKGRSAKSPTSPPLDLQPGEWVRVKTREQIRDTLNDRGVNRGLWFDREMMAFCGQPFQVRRRVTRIINETTGEMIELNSDCIMLENAVCSGELSPSRWFCPRKIYPYWRECWLERVHEPGPVTTS